MNSAYHGSARMSRPSVSLVIPMFNEELNIEHAVSAAVEALTKYSDDYELIVVDDASTDDSPAMVARMAEENPRIRVLRHAKNRKLGGTLRTGARTTGGGDDTRADPAGADC